MEIGRIEDVTQSIALMGAGELLRRSKGLIGDERITTALFVMHLIEIDRRRLYWGDGASSLFAWLVQKLNLSESSAAKRIAVARLARRDPELGAKMIQMLADGRLHLSGAYVLARGAEHGDVTVMVDQAVGRSRSDIERMVSGLTPEPIRRAVARPVSVVIAGADTAPETAETPVLPPQEGRIGDGGHALPMACGPKLAEPGFRFAPAPRIEAVRVSVTLKRPVYEMLHAAMKRGTGRAMEDVLERAIRMLDCKENPLRHVERRAAQKEGDLPPPGKRTHRPKMKSKLVKRIRISSSVRAQVWARDHGQCAFIGADGVRCAARDWLEVDHVQPVSRGGGNELKNLRLLCRGHNVAEAVHKLGPEVMGRFVACGETGGAEG